MNKNPLGYISILLVSYIYWSLIIQVLNPMVNTPFSLFDPSGELGTDDPSFFHETLSLLDIFMP